MLQKSLLSVKLYIANSSFYDSGNLVGNWVLLPLEEGILRKKLDEIRSGDDGYVVIGVKAPFKCTIENNIDVLELNRKLNRLTNDDAGALMAISEYDTLTLNRIIDIALNKKYVIYENVIGEEELGYKLYKEQKLPFDIPDYLVKYVDFKALGHEVCEKEAIHIIPEMRIAERLLYKN